MSPDARFALVLARIASATTAIRIRSEDAVRAENGSKDEIRQRLEAAVERREAVADELEQALA